MAYGKIKADAIIWDNSGSDVEESMSNMAGKLNASGGAMTGNLTLNAQNELRLADSDSSNHIAIKSPATVASNVTLTLPADDGDAGQFLQTNGSGVLDWAAVTQSTGNTGNAASGSCTGSAVTVTDIPNDAVKIIITWRDINWNASADIYVKVGTASGMISSGYHGNAIYTGASGSGANYTSYLTTQYGWTSGNSYTFDGICEINLMASNHYLLRSSSRTDANATYFFDSLAYVNAGAVIDRIQLGTSSGSFTAGSYTVSYFTET